MGDYAAILDPTSTPIDLSTFRLPTTNVTENKLVMFRLEKIESDYYSHLIKRLIILLHTSAKINFPLSSIRSDTLHPQRRFYKRLQTSKLLLVFRVDPIFDSNASHFSFCTSLVLFETTSLFAATTLLF